MIKKILVISSLVLCTFTAIAADNSPSAPQNSACADLAKGDLCSFVNSNGDNMNGSCNFGSNGKLTCVPTH